MSIYPKEWELTMEGDTFNSLKTDFNQILRKTLSNMESKSSELAELTVKVKISLKKEKERTTDDNLPRDIIVPKFDHKVSSVMQIKSEISGSLGGEYELVWDSDRGEYIMREIVDPQMNMFEAGYESAHHQGQVYDADYTVVDDGPPAPSGSKVAGLLPDKSGSTGDDSVCLKDFPDCICLTCMNNGSYDENGSCCTRHARDCRDTDTCVDYVNSYDADVKGGPYEYDQPFGQETCGSCLYIFTKGGKTGCNYTNGPDEEITADTPACEAYWKKDKNREGGEDE